MVINRVTKNSSSADDLMLLKKSMEDFKNAYISSKQILAVSAVGQAHRGFTNAINYKQKMYSKLEVILKAIKNKYNFNEDKVYKIGEYTAKINKLEGKLPDYQCNYFDISNQFKEFLVLKGVKHE